MVGNISKKYIAALIDSCKKTELKSVLKDLNEISTAFKSDKFCDIVNSPTIKDEQKINLILSFIEKPYDKIINLIKLLAKNRRLDLLPQITEGLSKSISISNNEFYGKIYSNKKLDKTQINALEEQISKKFGANIKLNPIVNDYNGIKIDIEDLGFEISFSIDRLKTKMREYILKAI